MCIRFVPKRNNLSSLSLEIRHPHPTSAWFTRTKLPPTLTLNSHTWPWILWIFYCLSMTCFFIFLQWNASSGEKILSFLNEERLGVVFYSYTVIFVFKHYKQLLLRNNCIDGSRPEDNLFWFLHWFHVLLFFWNLTAVSIFGQRLNDMMILSDADPDKHTTYETFSELLRLGDWNSRLDASPCKNVKPLLRLIVMMNLWWLKIPVSCLSFFIFYFILFLYIYM